ncbi:hypothetical protein GQX74_004680 [Glossina fuscipes]|nr:hypothetical protein GQX74_004680 [Glossina fuscipes]
MYPLTDSNRHVTATVGSHKSQRMVLSHVLAAAHPYHHNDKAFLTLESIKNDYMLYNSSDNGSYNAGHNERNHYHGAIFATLKKHQEVQLLNIESMYELAKEMQRIHAEY